MLECIRIHYADKKLDYQYSGSVRKHQLHHLTHLKVESRMVNSEHTYSLCDPIVGRSVFCLFLVSKSSLEDF